MARKKYKIKPPSLSDRDELGILNLEIEVPQVVQDAIDAINRERKSGKNFRRALVDEDGYLTDMGVKVQVAIAYVTSKDMGYPDEDEVDQIEIDVPTKEEAEDVYETQKAMVYSERQHKMIPAPRNALPKKLVKAGNKIVEIRDTKHPNREGHIEERDVADIKFGDRSKPFETLKKMLLDMNADKERFSAMEEVLDYTFKDMSIATQNGFISSDIHIRNYASGTSYKKKTRLIEQEERAMRSWKGIKEQYEWLIDATDLEQKIFLETGLHYEGNEDNPKYWFEVSKYLNDSRNNEHGTQQFASEEYGLGDFFGEVRARDESGKAMKWHDLTTEQKKDLYVRYSRGEDIGTVSQEEQKIKINYNLQGILNKASSYNQYIRSMKKNKKKGY